MKNLEVLNVSYNKLKELPDELESLKKLTKLYLNGNPLDEDQPKRLSTLCPNALVY